jgi:type VI secretion system VasD/TssJ family lipoprotein
MLRVGAAWLGALALGCAGAAADPPRACLKVAASENLNAFGGEPHVVVLSFYPLRNVTAFQAADLRELLRGGRPAGLTGEPWQTTVLPGQRLVFEEQLPRETASLGVVADYYRGPSRAVVEASCGWFGGESLVLTSGDLQIER